MTIIMREAAEQIVAAIRERGTLLLGEIAREMGLSSYDEADRFVLAGLIATMMANQVDTSLVIYHFCTPSGRPQIGARRETTSDEAAMLAPFVCAACGQAVNPPNAILCDFEFSIRGGVS